MSPAFSDILRSMDEAARRKLEAKIPSWRAFQIEVPATLNFQQCSGESAARYKASLVAEGARVADLTGGLGVDSWAFSQRSSAVWYNERDAALAAAVERNFGALGVRNAEFHSYDVGLADEGWIGALGAFRPDVIYLDPARRDSAGRKVFLLEECSPDVVALMPSLLSLSPVVMVKVSPMADITMLRRRLRPWISEIHVVGAEGECKELLCVCRAGVEQDGVRILLAEDGFVFAPSDTAAMQPDLPPEDFASLIPPTPGGAGPSRSRGHGRPRSPETGPAGTAAGATYLLFVPSGAMVKSGLGPGISLMDYDAHLAHFGKFYEVLENLPFASSVIKTLGRRFPQADVTARGVPVSSEQLRARLRTKPGGPVHIFACSLAGERRILVCRPFVRG